jgi:hypothetical protein
MKGLKGNIKMDPRERGYEAVSWTELPEDIAQH